MTADETEGFLAAGAKVLQVASLGGDGFPHLAPMWFVVDDGKVAFRSFSKSQKIINLRRDPRLTVLVEEGDAYETLKGVMIKGTAQLIDDPAVVLEMYVELARRYPFFPGVEPGSTGDAEVRAVFERFAAKNTAVVVQPQRVITWDHTKLGGAY
jgi:PPOX class probable F420-dependent enzyme